MVSALRRLRNLSLVITLLLSIIGILATVQAQNVSVGVFLTANDKNITWKSPSGDFAFGFHQISGEENGFLLAIWYAKIPERTIVWSANGGNLVERDSKVELSSSGQLVLKDRKDGELWRSPRSSGQVSHAAMLDTGNFVIVSRTNGGYIWETFDDPTDTILPTQELGVNGSLLSAFAEASYRKGKYLLRFNKGSLVLNQRNMFTGKPYGDYSTMGRGSRLMFNELGYLQLQSSNGSIQKFAPTNAVPQPKSFYYRATLDFYGVFTYYSHPRNPGNGESWSTLWFSPKDICFSFGRVPREVAEGLGNGPCGYNSFCSPEPTNGKHTCKCPDGFSLLDAKNPYIGCEQDYLSYCNPDGSTKEVERFELRRMQFVDFPFSDFGVFSPANELECSQSCLLDCACAVAILQDPTQSQDGSGTCWKKKLPLVGGSFNRDVIDRTALFKVPKSSYTNVKNSPIQNPKGNKNQNQIVLVLAVLLGTSALFNFFSLAAISLIVFCLFQGNFRGYKRIPSDLETNMRCFTFKDLELATNGFKEELGRGAFGRVYKGELPYGDHVAVKKLDKFVQEGEREFKTEVKVIGQTHHKNLVRLIGYCDEGEHRLLVYEFMRNGSLSSYLFGKIRPSWDQRLQIASGIAKGLTYLHEECSTQIIHCDIKPQNILLNDSYTAKISDFGLAKLLINNNTRTLTGIRGTKGYVAPEWFKNTPVTIKVDVYSFGVMLLEIICCRRCVEVEMEEAAILTEWAYECYNDGLAEELVENDEEARIDLGKLEMLLKIAIWCVQDDPLLRPSMRTVSMMLEGAAQVPNPPCPFLVD